GTGLGTSILIEDVRTGKYRPIPGEGGHVDFEAVDELEFRAAGWIRKHINRSPGNPMDRERIVSGPGLVNLYRALSELEPGDGNPRIAAEVVKADVYDRPAVIIQHAGHRIYGPFWRSRGPGPPFSGRHAQILAQLGMHHQGGNLQSLDQVLSLLAGRKPYAKANLMHLSILTDLPLLKRVSQVSHPAEQLFA